MSTDIEVIPISDLKTAQKVVVIDAKSSYLGRRGNVVSTATTKEMAAVSVRFIEGESAHWFLRDQIDKTTL